MCLHALAMRGAVSRDALISEAITRSWELHPDAWLMWPVPAAEMNACGLPVATPVPLKVILVAPIVSVAPFSMRTEALDKTFAALP